MVSRSEMARIALRHDTAMSLAMLRALGVSERPRRRCTRAPRRDPYDGIAELFANHGSPMDRM